MDQEGGIGKEVLQGVDGLQHLLGDGELPLSGSEGVGEWTYNMG